MRRFVLVAIASGWIAAGGFAAELISLDVLPCGKPGEAGGLAGGLDLLRVPVGLARYPRALCNDGSPGVFYARPFSSEENRDKWHIQLQGGGSCRDGQSCAERWCSSGTNFGMDKMTTTLSKASIRADGILSPDPENQLATWNHVLVYYCSSDEWAGRADRVDVSATSAGGTLDYAITFHGGDIVDAVIDILRTPARRRGVRRPDAQASLVLPDLDRATHVLLTGASAGSGGWRNNADRVAARLRATSVACSVDACPLVIGVLLDSGFQPSLEASDWSRSAFREANAAFCTWEGFMSSEYQAKNLDLWQWMGDDSCIAYHATVEPSTQWKCGDGTHVIPHHITTPMFVGQDLQDQLLSGNFVETGFGSLEEFGERVATQLGALVMLDATAEEGSAHTGVALRSPGTFGSQCRGHENLGSSKDFFDTTVELDGVRYSYHDVVWNWWTGVLPKNVVHEFDEPGSAPDCP